MHTNVIYLLNRVPVPGDFFSIKGFILVQVCPPTPPLPNHHGNISDDYYHEVTPKAKAWGKYKQTTQIYANSSEAKSAARLARMVRSEQRKLCLHEQGELD